MLSTTISDYFKPMLVSCLQMEIGERFREIREAKNLTQEEVAKKIGWIKQEIQRVESSSDLNTGRLKTALKGLDITLAEFFESRVVSRYSEPSHQALHEKLQGILEHGSEAKSAIQWNIDAIYAKIKRDGKSPPRAKQEERAAPRRLIK